MQEWVSVKDRLPDYDDYVIWCYENGSMFFECIDKDWDSEYLTYFLDGSGHKESSGTITHWMPKPEYPVNDK